MPLKRFCQLNGETPLSWFWTRNFLTVFEEAYLNVIVSKSSFVASDDSSIKDVGLNF